MAGRKKSCGTCKYWNGKRNKPVNGWGGCDKGESTGDVPDEKDSTAVAYDYESYGGQLVTQGRHYCSMYERADA